MLLFIQLLYLIVNFSQLQRDGRTYIQKIFVDDNLFDCDCHLEGLRLYLQHASSWDELFGDGLMQVICIFHFSDCINLELTLTF